MGNIDDLAERICEPGNEFWSGERSDIDGRFEMYLDLTKISKAIRQFVNAARAEAIREAADRAWDWHKLVYPGDEPIRDTLVKAIFADDQEGPQDD